MANNKNDNPLNEIDIRLPLGSFSSKNMFEKIATLSPNQGKEKLDVFGECNNEYKNKENLVYMFVIDGYIQKIGSSTTSMKKRISSYNCGKKKYRDNGTCSTTNYFCLQTFLNINKKVDVYAFYPKTETIEIDVFGKTEKVTQLVQSKIYERFLLSRLKEKGTMPILCTQV